MNEPQQRPTTGQIIWETMQSLRDDGQIISRQRLMELTGLTFTKIDDHVSRWVDDGRLRRVVDGVFELVDSLPEPRAVSVTDLHDGQTLIEVGDQQMRLWPTEIRALGLRLVGSAMQFAQLQTQHDMGYVVADLTVRLRSMANELANLRREKRAARTDTGQKELL